MGTTDTALATTVLMIEDHDDTACLLRFILERNGYAVRHAPDGWNAKRLTETSDPPDLIVLDITLPSVSGLEVLRTIRTTPEWQWTPVIMLTADARDETMAEASNLGATEYIKKPFAPERLMKSIHLILADHKQSAGTRARTLLTCTPPTAEKTEKIPIKSVLLTDLNRLE